jgi:hypothetical protein
MLDLKTGALRLSRDVTWLGKTYGEYTEHKNREEDDEDHDEDEGEEYKSQMENDEQEQDIVDEETKELEEEQPTETEWKEVKFNRQSLRYQPRPEGQTRSGKTYKDITALAQENSDPNPYEVLYQEEET